MASKTDLYIVPHFRDSELLCKHCSARVGYNQKQFAFLAAVSRLRKIVGPLIVTSYYRCPDHPLTIKRPGSAHARGLAIDVRSPKLSPTELFFIAKGVDHFTGFGISEGGNFLHLDHKPGRLAIWIYMAGSPVTLLRLSRA